MHIWPDCIYCILRMAINTARFITKDDKEIKIFVKQIMEIDALQGNKWDTTSPAVIKDVWLILNENFGTIDPLDKTKKEQNDKALMLYPSMKDYVFTNKDSLSEALKLSVLGNSIDIMRGGVEKLEEEIIPIIKNISISKKQVKKIQRRLETINNLVYIGDNCGEIVFDKMFIENIKRYTNIKVTYIVRSLPVLNDATMSDARYVGMDMVAHVVENGIPYPFPGFTLHAVSPAIQQLIHESDLIIAKGGGNYDTMTEDKMLKGKTFFLVESKCQPYCIIHNAPLGSLIIDDF
ncbi:MAG TPA: hypothetical protein DDW17_09315 [Deltaproteobacteria bacterium]|nr:hypothetical protein [Deltaproteobacteria bacterium]